MKGEGGRKQRGRGGIKQKAKRGRIDISKIENFLKCHKESFYFMFSYSCALCVCLCYLELHHYGFEEAL